MAGVFCVKHCDISFPEWFFLTQMAQIYLYKMAGRFRQIIANRDAIRVNLCNLCPPSFPSFKKQSKILNCHFHCLTGRKSGIVKLKSGVLKMKSAILNLKSGILFFKSDLHNCTRTKTKLKSAPTNFSQAVLKLKRDVLFFKSAPVKVKQAKTKLKSAPNNFTLVILELKSAVLFFKSDILFFKSGSVNFT